MIFIGFLIVYQYYFKAFEHYKILYLGSVELLNKESEIVLSIWPLYPRPQMLLLFAPESLIERKKNIRHSI